MPPCGGPGLREPRDETPWPSPNSSASDRERGSSRSSPGGRAALAGLPRLLVGPALAVRLLWPERPGPRLPGQIPRAGGPGTGAHGGQRRPVPLSTAGQHPGHAGLCHLAAAVVSVTLAGNFLRSITENWSADQDDPAQGTTGSTRRRRSSTSRRKSSARLHIPRPAPVGRESRRSLGKPWQPV